MSEILTSHSKRPPATPTPEIIEPVVRCLKLAELRATQGWTRSGLTFRIYDVTQAERPDRTIIEIETGRRPAYSDLREQIVKTFQFFVSPAIGEDDIFPERAQAIQDSQKNNPEIVDLEASF